MASSPAEPDLPALTAVIAHGLLNSVAVSGGAISTVQRYWATLGASERDRLLRQAQEHLMLISDFLLDLVRGLPPESRSMLEALEDLPDFR